MENKKENFNDRFRKRSADNKNTVELENEATELLSVFSSARKSLKSKLYP
jgi:hypothetical protein